MAVHAALNSLTQILENLMHNDHEQCDFPMPLMNDDEGRQIVKYLHETLCFFQSFLEENYHHHPPVVDGSISLEARIRDAAYKAEDLIESHISDDIVSRQNELFGFRRGFRRSIEAVHDAVLLRRKQYSSERPMDPRVHKFKKEYKHFQKVMEEIYSIVEQAKKIQSSSSTNIINDKEEDEEDVWPPITDHDSFGAAPSKIVGVDEELLKIKDWACGGSSSRLQIISIVGMGGTGKTTLAKSIFDDSLIAYHFHTRAWVTISQRYCLRDILLSLLHFVTGTSNDISSQGDDKLKESIYKSLKGRRYLIVMDDIWDTIVWDDFRRILPDDCNGSRVILTTRLEDVAVYADESRSHLHQMQFLNKDQSWKLLKEKVFAQESCPLELEIIGKKIAAKCGGLPLAVVLIAGLLTKAAHRAPQDWQKFAKHVSSTLAIDDDIFSKTMALSYNHLPHHLKPCFLYLGGFPEDREIPIFKLLQLWITEGFIRQVKHKSLEEAAEECLKDLARRNLVSTTKKSSIGKSRFCRIHDLLRDFCIQKSKDDHFFLHVPRSAFLSEETEYTRRLFLSCQRIGKVLKNTTSLRFRSIINVSSVLFEETELSSLAAASKLIRVFDELETNQLSFPVEVTKLFHLRYLSFIFSSFGKYVVPASISRLRNLQTLIFRSSTARSLSFLDGKPPNIHLPDEIWRMPQLRHLISQHACHLPSPPIAPRIGAKVPVLLPNLQTLSRIANFTFNQECIEMIPNLRKLGVMYTNWNSTMGWSYYRLHNLVHLHQLESLYLSIRSQRLNNFPVESVFPPNLRKLTLHRCSLPLENMTVIGSLPNLEVLKLRKMAFVGKEWVTVEGEFSQLKFLVIDGYRLERWQAENSHFPRLERLIIRNCPQLQEIPREIGDIPTLQLIEVGPNSKSAADSAMRIKEEQRDMGNDSLQVRVVY